MTETLDHLQVGIFVDPNCIVPDIIGVYTAFCDAPNCDIHFIWKHTNPWSKKGGIAGLHSFPMYVTTTNVLSKLQTPTTDDS